MKKDFRLKGVGIGLRGALADAIFDAENPPFDWLEVHPENYIERGGRFEWILHQARERWELGAHGLTMSFGNAHPFSQEDLKKRHDFLKDNQVEWYSDHLCFSANSSNIFSHDLLPIPFNDEALEVVSDRICEAQDILEVPVAIENISYYARQADDPLEEARFIRRVLEKTHARLLLDINNVFVNSQNLGFDPYDFLELLPTDNVIQYHVAGHMIRPDGLRIDTHGNPIPQPVYDLIPWVLRRFGDHPILIERDQNFPPIQELFAEVERVQQLRAEVFEEPAE